jgi:hypothetical protein
MNNAMNRRRHVFKNTRASNWQVFDVGSDKDFAREVERTGKNKQLIRLLAGRKKRERGAAIPLAQVKKQLGLE